MKKFLNCLNDLLNTIKEHRIGTYSAASAYFVFICLIPFLTILIYLIPYTTISSNDLTNLVETVFPSYAYSLSFSIIDEIYSKSSAILPLSIIIMFWTASKAMVSIRNGLNDINDFYERKNFLLVRLIATLYTVVAIIIIFIISLLSLFGSKFHEFIYKYNLKIINIVEVVFDYHLLITLISYFLVFVFLYAFLPAKNNKIKDVLPGAMFSTLVCQLFSKIFNFLLSNYISFSMYGSLAAIVVIMIYFNFFFYLFFIGGCLNTCLKKDLNNNEIQVNNV